MHFISITITSSLPQTIRNDILEVGDPVLYSTGPPERPGVSEAGEGAGEGAVGWGGRRCAAQGSEGDARGAAPGCCGHREP